MRLIAWVVLMMICTFVIGSPPPSKKTWRPIPKASPQAAEKLKKAFAAYSQGHYEQAIQLALEVYKQEGNTSKRGM